MKWYNKDKTRMVDMNCINSYWFRDKPQTESEESSFKLNGPHMSLNVNGNMENFCGDEAKELYKMLISEKEVI